MRTPLAEQARRYGPPLLGVVLLVAVAVVLHRELKNIPIHDVVAYLRALPPPRIALALALSAVSYAVLTAYDALALAYVQHWLGYGKIALASFVGYVLNHNLGPIFLGGSAVRYRLYSSWGLSAVEIAQVIAFTGLTFWLGFLLLAGVVLVVEPRAVASLLHLDPFWSRTAAVVALLLVVAYLVRCSLPQRSWRLGGWEIRLPSEGIAFTQIAVACVDWVAASSVLWVVLPDAPGLTFPVFFGAFLLCQVIGVASTVPAGLGVFEATMLLALSSWVDKPDLLGALLAFRVVYYLVPLVAATLLLAAHELVGRRRQAAEVGRLLNRWVPEIVPQALAVLTFVAGVLLLAGGAIPTPPKRLDWLASIVSIWVVDLSNFVASVVGMGLLLLARGLQLRLNAAWALTVAGLAIGVAMSLLRSFDVALTVLLAATLLALLPCKRHFDRPTALLDEPLTPSWTFAAVLVLIGVGWLLFFSYRHVEYQAELWWQFELSSQASRSMRAVAGAAILFIAYGTARLLRPAIPDPPPPSEDLWQRIEKIVADSPVAAAHLALVGDKQFLTSSSGRSFLMYGISGRSFVAMGDPIGEAEDAHELAWRFRELADRHGARTVFYEVGSARLPLYVDLGLTLLKLGEEARVPLASFDLEGPARARLRRSHRQAVREGCRFEIVPAPQVDAILPELQQISDAWLAEKSTREKGFSLGRFDPDYLRRFPIALVRRDEKTIAFANLWPSGQREEMSVDLMRHLPAGPAGLMDFLFIELLLWSREGGYRWFSLGLAPFSGMDTHSLAPLWSRAGALLFRHGEHFYNFQGLRHYKDKFDPEWSPRYLASPGGFALPKVLTDVASLVAGGLKGVVAR